MAYIHNGKEILEEGDFGYYDCAKTTRPHFNDEKGNLYIF